MLARLRFLLLFALIGCSGQPGEVPPLVVADGQTERASFCDALRVMRDKCVRCHADPPVNGAPFALTDYAATQEPAPSSKDPQRTRADRMLAAVESDYMPYTALLLAPPVEPLTCAEKTTLLTWLRSGAEPPANGDTTCDGVVPRLLACKEAL